MMAGPTGKAAVVPAKASSPGMANPEPSKPLEYSPGVAELSPAERRRAFMAATAKPAEETPKEEPSEEPEEPAAEEEEETPTETEQAEEENEADPNAAEKSEEEESEDELVSGLAKHAAKNPELKALLKRTQAVLKQNSDRGKEVTQLRGELETLRAKPAQVLAPSEAAPLAHATTPEQVDAEVKDLISVARQRVRWLENHLEGGVWQEGTEHELPMTAGQVAKALDYYEEQRENAAKLGETRKAELAEYAATLKTLGVPAEELVKPAVPTRESKFFGRVPEMMRDPQYLQFLADAKAGREAREEKARGVKTVKVDPGKVKPKAKVPNDGERNDGKTPRAAESTTDLNKLRSQAEQGDQTARMAMRRAFVQKIE